MDALSETACTWTTILGIEISPKQVLKCLASASVHTEKPTALKHVAEVWQHMAKTVLERSAEYEEGDEHA